jgi:hypothetical protein
MNAVIHQRVKVDARHAVSLVDTRLTPGEEVEIIVRPATNAANATAPSLWALAGMRSMDAPPDYSTTFEQKLP